MPDVAELQGKTATFRKHLELSQWFAEPVFAHIISSSQRHIGGYKCYVEATKWSKVQLGVITEENQCNCSTLPV